MTADERGDCEAWRNTANMAGQDISDATALLRRARDVLDTLHPVVRLVPTDNDADPLESLVRDLSAFLGDK